MSETRDHKPRFQGYTSPTYTPVPDVLFDEQLPELSGAELKVLLYIMRRTFGFKKDSDTISLSQITGGITSGEGQVLDRGTGLSKDSVTRAVKSLEEQGIIFRTRRRSDRKGDEPTSYALNIGPVSENRTPRGGEIGHPEGAKSDTQETVRQETVDNISNLRIAQHKIDDTGPSGGRAPSRSGAHGRGRAVGGGPAVAGAKQGEMVPLGEAIAAWQGRQNTAAGTAAPRADGESGGERPRTGTWPKAIGATLRHRPLRPRCPTAYDEDRQVLLAYVADFAREFNDRAPLKASTTRAHNLLKASGLGREAFIERLYQARGVVKERGASIRSRGENGAGGWPTAHKMAYFFAVLEDLLGLRPDGGPSPGDDPAG